MNATMLPIFTKVYGVFPIVAFLYVAMANKGENFNTSSPAIAAVG
jgi:hypothetical protein